MVQLPWICRAAHASFDVMRFYTTDLEPEINNDTGSNEDLDPSILGANDSDDNNRSSSEYQTCIVSNFYISDVIVAGLPIEGNSIYDDIT
ncbi:unnamed protein product [Camellia sinensis]